ncbi:hypothetical protein GW915_00695 [bacterium]|nr:hypothetical protein [bacterium]
MNKKLLISLMTLGTTVSAHAWEGPICRLDRDQEIVLTLKSLAGEEPGKLIVNFDDNDGEIAKVQVEPSLDYLDTHKVTLHYTEGSSGIVGVILQSPLSKEASVRYEFEFRQDNDCSGASIEAQYKAAKTLSELVAEYNSKVLKEAPAFGYVLTETLITDSIKEQFKGITSDYRDDYLLIQNGAVPEGVRLDYLEGNDSFYIRLSVERGNVGYSLRVGEDIIR